MPMYPSILFTCFLYHQVEHHFQIFFTISLPRLFFDFKIYFFIIINSMTSMYDFIKLSIIYIIYPTYFVCIYSYIRAIQCTTV